MIDIEIYDNLLSSHSEKHPQISPNLPIIHSFTGAVSIQPLVPLCPEPSVGPSRERSARCRSALKEPPVC